MVANCNKFKSQFSVYCIAKRIHDLSDEEQIAHLLLMMGPDCLPIYEKFSWGRRTRKLNGAIQRFDEYFQPIRNVIYERSIFNRMCQEEGQSINKFITAVQTQSDNCQYGQEIVSELIRDRIAVGVETHDYDNT